MKHFYVLSTQVYQLLHGEQYYEAFVQSKVYLKVLDDLGFNKMNGEPDTFSLDDGMSWFFSLYYVQLFICFCLSASQTSKYHGTVLLNHFPKP